MRRACCWVLVVGMGGYWGDGKWVGMVCWGFRGGTRCVYAGRIIWGLWFKIRMDYTSWY
jgi:hypothetical protein